MGQVFLPLIGQRCDRFTFIGCKGWLIIFKTENSLEWNERGFIPQELIELSNSVIFDKLINLGETSRIENFLCWRNWGWIWVFIAVKNDRSTSLWRHVPSGILTPQFTTSNIINFGTKQKFMILIRHLALGLLENVARPFASTLSRTVRGFPKAPYMI